MSFALMQAVLCSNHTKSSTRFAQVLLAYHACPRCGRVYCSKARLAREMNIAPRNVQALLQRLRDEQCLAPTGETTPQGIPVYRLLGEMLSSPDDFHRGDAFISGGEMKASCRWCRGEMNSSPNRQVVDRRGKDDARAREQTCGLYGCDRPQCPHWQLCAVHACCEHCAAEAEEG